MNNSTILQVLNATHDTVADLRKELLAERKFRDEFESFMLACKVVAKHRSTPGDAWGDMLYSTTISGVVLIWNELKAQHLEAKEKETK